MRLNHFFMGMVAAAGVVLAASSSPNDRGLPKIHQQQDTFLSNSETRLQSIAYPIDENQQFSNLVPCYAMNYDSHGIKTEYCDPNYICLPSGRQSVPVNDEWERLLFGGRCPDKRRRCAIKMMCSSVDSGTSYEGVMITFARPDDTCESYWGKIDYVTTGKKEETDLNFNEADDCNKTFELFPPSGESRFVIDLPRWTPLSILRKRWDRWTPAERASGGMEERP